MTKRRIRAGEMQLSSTPPAHAEAVENMELDSEQMDPEEYWEQKMKRTWSEFERDLVEGLDDSDALDDDLDYDDYDPLKEFNYDID